MSATASADHRPTRLGGWIAVGAALLVLAAGGLYSWRALSTGVLAVALLVWGLARVSARTVDAGGAGLLASAVFAGVDGAPAAVVLVGVAAAVVAWDLAGNALSVGRQLGRAARTTRLELVHAGGSVLVGTVAAGLGYGIFRGATGGRPVLALVLLLVAVVLIASALR